MDYIAVMFIFLSIDVIIVYFRMYDVVGATKVIKLLLLITTTCQALLFTSTSNQNNLNLLINNHIVIYYCYHYNFT